MSQEFAQMIAHSSNYYVTVTGNLASNEVVTVTPNRSFVMRDTKGIKDDITTSVSQPVTKFVDEQAKKTSRNANDASVAALGQTKGNVKVDDLTSGTWEGTFTFNISLSEQA